jgi:hypothetical protein
VVQDHLVPDAINHYVQILILPLDSIPIFGGSNLREALRGVIATIPPHVE